VTESRVTDERERKESREGCERLNTPEGRRCNLGETCKWIGQVSKTNANPCIVHYPIFIGCVSENRINRRRRD
jgi:hypothetical protein